MRQLSELFDLQNVPIPLIDNVRHWGEQISVMWVEIFDLHNVSIPLIDNVRHWGEQISAIWAEFFNL